MDNIFCTLFDSFYLDKGLILYDSMCKHIESFKLYVFAFDDKCYEIIKAIGKEDLIPVSVRELEFAYPCLLEAKKDRNTVEYNWTCSSWIIKYVLEVFNERICTYIDADMMFFASPEPVFQTMRSKNCSVIIVPHRYPNDKVNSIEGPKTGYYCVEFNTFVNDKNGKTALDWWAKECCKWCHYVVPTVDQWYGDQKYLNEFPKKFDGVYVCDHYGVGLANWNDNRMELKLPESDSIILIDKETKEEYPLIIYHYAEVRFLSNHWIKVTTSITGKRLHRLIFDAYIDEIIKKRRLIKNNYGFELTRSRKICAKNPFIKLYQILMPYLKVKHIRNLYRVDI